MNKLHELMDEQVDVYAENDRFQKILESYYQTRDDKYIEEMWPIMYRCGANIIKKKLGKYLKWEDISNYVIDIIIIVIGRIKDTDKYPDGYRIKCLPKVMDYAYLNVWSKKNRNDFIQEIDIDKLNNILYDNEQES